MEAIQVIQPSRSRSNGAAEIVNRIRSRKHQWMVERVAAFERELADSIAALEGAERDLLMAETASTRGRVTFLRDEKGLAESKVEAARRDLAAFECDSEDPGVAAAQEQVSTLLAKVEPSAWTDEVEPILAELAATTAAQQRIYIRLRDVFDRAARTQNQLQSAAARLGVDSARDLGVSPRNWSDMRLRMSKVMARALIDAGGRISELGEVYSRVPHVTPA
jgi:hypothetical protein